MEYLSQNNQAKESILCSLITTKFIDMCNSATTTEGVPTFQIDGKQSWCVGNLDSRI